MVAEKHNHQRVFLLLKNKTLGQAGAAFEDASDQFANANAAVDVRIAESRA